MSKRHALKRTSPKRQDFIGVCMNCGRTELGLGHMNEECFGPKSQDEMLIKAIRDE